MARTTLIWFVCHALADELTMGFDIVGQKALSCLIDTDTCYATAGVEARVSDRTDGARCRDT
jgi:hypothetical protein